MTISCVTGTANSSTILNGMVNSHISLRHACSGVRQGSCLSSAVFNVFMNVFIKALKCQRAGCCISSLFVVCILYADDVLLLSPSVIGLQNMLDKCSE